MVEDRKIAAAVILSILVSLSLGFAVGLLYRSGVSRPLVTEREVPAAQPSRKAKSVTENKVVKFVSQSVSGTVAEVSEEVLVLEEAGDTLSFKVAPTARIVRVTLPSPAEATPSAEPKREEIRLDQIKTGDKVDALLSSQPDGSFLATEVTVLVEVE